MTITGADICNACKSRNVQCVYDFGRLPIANELLRSNKQEPDTFPLKFSICEDCLLGQVGQAIPPTRLFEDYRYMSSMSRMFLDHCRQLSSTIAKFIRSRENSGYVLEIASNDGYLMDMLIKEGVDCLGIEPAKNIAAIASNKGHNVISEFFGTNLAKLLAAKYGKPQVIVANNVLAHVPDLHDFLNGLSILSSKDTVIIVENPSLPSLLQNTQFDSIYHEHFSYLSAAFLSKFVTNFGLELINLDTFPIHGGTNRYYLRRISSRKEPTNIRIDKICDLENSIIWEYVRKPELFKNQIENIRERTYAWMSERSKGNTYVGFGAAAKASTFLSTFGLGTEFVEVIADSSPEKQGRFISLNSIPIVSTEQAAEFIPSEVVVFTWNILPEIQQVVSAKFPGRPKCRTFISNTREEN